MAGILALPLTLYADPLDEQQADDIESEDELAHQKRMVCAVIQRLITKEHWIIGLNDDEVCAHNVCVRIAPAAACGHLKAHWHTSPGARGAASGPALASGPGGARFRAQSWPSPSASGSHMHTCTQSHMHTHAYAYAHAHAHTLRSKINPKP